jgi:hypothetical protein
MAQGENGTVVGRQALGLLEDIAAPARNRLKLWWVQGDSNPRPAD